MTNNDLVYGVIGFAGVVCLILIAVELYDRFRAKNQQFTNDYLAERARQNATDRLLQHLYPTTKGPHGFHSQNERRKETTTKKECSREWRTTDGQKRILTASTARVSARPLSDKKERIQ